ncbi:MAG: FadR family transcriptional regulator [Actinobacteria bacterium]|nr:FadR family transcriptional regulator [Actinomycetota bacterium]
MVAGELRERILSGRIPDGGSLPKHEDLMEEFQVSGPSVREAFRILETEGLITVRRGNVGGAIVHGPQPATAAYILGVVMQARDVGLHDVAVALQKIEPMCVAMCAARGDRKRTLVPRLKEINERTLAAVGDTEECLRLTREFHREIVDHCGNETMILIVNSLETLWSAQLVDWAKGELHDGLPSRAARRAGIEDHEEIVRLIEEGDAEKARHAAEVHLQRSQRNTVGSETRRVKAALIRPEQVEMLGL